MIDPAWILDALLAASWSDVVDILLLSFVIYRGLVALQGTRAMQSLLGLLLVAVLYVMAWATGLTAVHWVLDNLFVYAVIAVLILFQDDIRRALARAGGTIVTGGTRMGARSEASVLEEVIKACFALAHRRIGALILLERSGSLDAYIEGGHSLDAQVSTELLQSLFHPSSPLHDGAVVIADARVVAAGVFLPISLSKQLGRALGTRHRAAVGITEESDGICLVVSEERGTVALVSRGEIVPVADANDLRAQLVERMGEAPTPPEAPEAPVEGAPAS